MRGIVLTISKPKMHELAAIRGRGIWLAVISQTETEVVINPLSVAWRHPQSVAGPMTKIDIENPVNGIDNPKPPKQRSSQQELCPRCQTPIVGRCGRECPNCHFKPGCSD